MGSHLSTKWYVMRTSHVTPQRLDWRQMVSDFEATDRKRKPLAFAVWAVSQLPPVAKHESTGAIRQSALDAIMKLAHDSRSVVPRIAWRDENGKDHDIDLDPPIPCDICGGMEARDEIDKYLTVPDNRVDYWLNDDFFDIFVPRLLDEYADDLEEYEKCDGGTMLRCGMEDDKQCLQAFVPEFGSEADKERFALLSERHAVLVGDRRMVRITSESGQDAERRTLNVIHFRNRTLEFRCNGTYSPISIFSRHLHDANSRVEDHRLSNLEILFPDVDDVIGKKRKRDDDTADE